MILSKDLMFLRYYHPERRDVLEMSAKESVKGSEVDKFLDSVLKEYEDYARDIRNNGPLYDDLQKRFQTAIDNKDNDKMKELSGFINGTEDEPGPYVRLKKATDERDKLRKEIANFYVYMRTTGQEGLMDTSENRKKLDEIFSGHFNDVVEEIDVHSAVEYYETVDKMDDEVRTARKEGTSAKKIENILWNIDVEIPGEATRSYEEDFSYRASLDARESEGEDVSDEKISFAFEQHMNRLCFDSIDHIEAFERLCRYRYTDTGDIEAKAIGYNDKLHERHAPVYDVTGNKSQMEILNKWDFKDYMYEWESKRVNEILAPKQELEPRLMSQGESDILPPDMKEGLDYRVMRGKIEEKDGRIKSEKSIFVQEDEARSVVGEYIKKTCDSFKEDGYHTISGESMDDSIRAVMMERSNSAYFTNDMGHRPDIIFTKSAECEYLSDYMIDGESIGVKMRDEFVRDEDSKQRHNERVSDVRSSKFRNGLTKGDKDEIRYDVRNKRLAMLDAVLPNLQERDRGKEADDDLQF